MSFGIIKGHQSRSPKGQTLTRSPLTLSVTDLAVRLGAVAANSARHFSPTSQAASRPGRTLRRRAVVTARSLSDLRQVVPVGL